MSPTQLAKLGDDFGIDPVCVGPFMFDHRVAGDSITVIKSPYYYDRKDVHLDKIVFKPLPDAAAAAAALKAGDLQVLDDVSTTELDGLEQTRACASCSRNSSAGAGIRFNIGNKNGVGNLPYANVGTPLASSAEAAEGVRGGDRPQRRWAGSSSAATMQTGCTPISPASPWFDATQSSARPTTLRTRGSSSRLRASRTRPCTC